MQQLEDGEKKRGTSFHARKEGTSALKNKNRQWRIEGKFAHDRFSLVAQPMPADKGEQLARKKEQS